MKTMTVKSPSKRNAVVFDFDGTLADSFTVFVHAMEYALNRQPFSPEEIENLRQHSMREAIKILKIKKWRLPWLVAKGMREIDRHQDDITIFQGIPELLKQLSRRGHKLYIVSSHSKKGINLFLKQYGLSDYIDYTYAKVKLFGKSKALKKLQHEHGIAPAECIFVGDEVRDIEAAEKAGVKCIAVTWGFNTATSLKNHNPSGIATKPKELLRVLEKLPY